MFHQPKYDELFGSKKKKKAKAEAAQNMVKAISGAGNMSSADIQLALAMADGKLTKREKKLVQKKNKKDAATERRYNANAAKTERVGLRSANRADREIGKAEARAMPKERIAPEPETTVMTPQTLPGEIKMSDPVTTANAPYVTGSGQIEPMPPVSSGGGGGGSMPDLTGWGGETMSADNEAAESQGNEAGEQSQGFKLSPVMIGIAVLAAIFIFKPFKL